jgi:uncharacterized protein (TIGR00251 family)
MSGLIIEKTETGVIFTAKVVPGSSRTAVCGLLNGMLKIRIASAPERGKANQCLLELLAKVLGIKKNALSIISGEHNPVKRLRIEGMSSETLTEKLGLNNTRS